MKKSNVISKEKYSQQQMLEAWAVNVSMSTLKELLEIIKVQAEEKWTCREILLDANAAVKQVSRTVPREHASFICCMHGFQRRQHCAFHATLLKNVPQCVTWHKVKGLLEIHKAAVKLVLGCLAWLTKDWMMKI